MSPTEMANIRIEALKICLRRNIAQGEYGTPDKLIEEAEVLAKFIFG